MNKKVAIEEFLNEKPDLKKKNIWGKIFSVLVWGAKAYLRYEELRK